MLGTSKVWEAALLSWKIFWMSPKDMPRSPSHIEAMMTRATRVMAQEPMSHTTGGRPRFLGRSSSTGGRRRMAAVSSTSLTMEGAAASSVLKRWKLPVRADCRTCSPLAMAVTAKGGRDFNTSREIMSRWSFRRWGASWGSWPVRA